MRKCKDCGVNIDNKGNRAIRCEACQKVFRYIAFHASGTGRRAKQQYQLWKFLNENDFTKEELRVLFQKRKEKCKYAKRKKDTKKIQGLRTEMLIINTKYNEVKNER